MSFLPVKNQKNSNTYRKRRDSGKQYGETSGSTLTGLHIALPGNFHYSKYIIPSQRIVYTRKISDNN